jgi:hypothetical protein
VKRRVEAENAGAREAAEEDPGGNAEEAEVVAAGMPSAEQEAFAAAESETSGAPEIASANVSVGAPETSSANESVGAPEIASANVSVGALETASENVSATANADAAGGGRPDARNRTAAFPCDRASAVRASQKTGLSIARGLRSADKVRVNERENYSSTEEAESPLRAGEGGRPYASSRRRPSNGGYPGGRPCRYG